MKRKLASLMLAVLLLSGCSGQPDSAASGNVAGDTSGRVAGENDMAPPVELDTGGLTPVHGTDLKDGIYDIDVDSSSSMFRVVSCRLTVENGKMTAVMTMGGTGYLYVYMGTGEEAAAASEDAYIPFAEDENGAHTYTVPVEVLNSGVDCAAFSKNREMWYDRTMVFRADALPLDAYADGFLTTAETLGLSDGDYTVEITLSGGSGKAAVESPARLTVADGKATAVIEWSSSNYDYMKIDGVQYDAVDTGGNSTFIIPVPAFDFALPVLADTVAMSTPHEIEYSLYFDSSTLRPSARSMELLYAKEFGVDYYDGGALITINGTGSWFLLSEEGKAPEDLDRDIPILRQPLDSIYLAASSAMDFFRELDAMDRVGLTSTAYADWSLPEVKAALDSGELLYAGKYSAPDYELLLEKGTQLAIESTMIYHSPEISEQLEALGVPVMVERSSYETHPLGRLEWIRLYGLLTGKETEAQAFFDGQMDRLAPILETGGTEDGPTVAFFYISSNGHVNVRKPGDYISQLIGMAGGRYVFADLDAGENDLSTMNMQMESFYAGARDADILIYNSTIDGELYTLDQLLQKSELLADFKAFQTGDVWCTGKNMFQQTTGAGDLLTDLHQVISGQTDGNGEPVFLHRLT